jgi:hypothetical protein
MGARTEKAKELIGSVSTYTYPVPLCFSSRPMELVEKSEFLRVIDELTGWNKVEDGLPEIQKTNDNRLVAVMNNKGEIYPSLFSVYGASMQEHIETVFTYWRYIY